MDILSLLTKMLGGFNIPTAEDKVLTWLKETGTNYPDLRSRTDALAEYLKTTIAEVEPTLDPAMLKDTLWGIASDIVHGTAGVDPGAWMGGG